MINFISGLKSVCKFLTLFQLKASCFSIILLFPCFVSASYLSIFNLQTVEVFGYAKLDTQFDQLQVNIMIKQEGRSIEKLSDVVKHNTEAIISLAKRFHIPSQAIQLSRTQINKKINNQQPYIQGIELNKKTIQNGNVSRNLSNVYINGNSIPNNSTNNQISQYQAINIININLSGIIEPEAFLSQAVKSSGAEVTPYYSSSKNASTYRQDALKAAIDDARQKALIISGQSQEDLGEIRTIKELPLSELNSHDQDSPINTVSKKCTIELNRANRHAGNSMNNVFNLGNSSKAYGQIPNCFEAKVKVIFTKQ